MPPDILPYDEDLLRHTLGSSTHPTPFHTGSNTSSYSNSERNQGVQTLREGASKRIRIPETTACDLEKKLEIDPDSSANNSSKGPLWRSKKQNRRQDHQHPNDGELPFQEGAPLQEEDNQKFCSLDREIFMAIISEIEEHNDDPMERVDLVDYNSSDYDEYLSDIEVNETEIVNYKIPPPPPGVTVTVHPDDDQNELKKIRNQKRCMRHRLATERCQQLGNSFDYSNSDLHNVINIGRDARTVVINRRKEREEAEAYSPTSNYRLPDN